jgi:hypothetical protein
MQRFFAVRLSCVLLLVSSGFAIGHNRLDKNTYVPHGAPSSHVAASRFTNDGRNKPEFRTGQRSGSANAHQKIVFNRRTGNGVRR